MRAGTWVFALDPMSIFYQKYTLQHTKHTKHIHRITSLFSLKSEFFITKTTSKYSGKVELIGKKFDPSDSVIERFYCIYTLFILISITFG